MDSSWPISWHGSTNIKCGDDGNFIAVVTTESQPAEAHKRMLELVCARWGEIWPEFKRSITQLMVSYGRQSPDWSSVRSVYFELPDEPIAEGAEWSIGAVFSSDDTLWSLPYCGWAACPQQAQAIY